jgi:hypothetical protein
MFCSVTAWWICSGVSLVKWLNWFLLFDEVVPLIDWGGIRGGVLVRSLMFGMWGGGDSGPVQANKHQKASTTYNISATKNQTLLPY